MKRVLAVVAKGAVESNSVKFWWNARRWMEVARVLEL